MKKKKWHSYGVADIVRDAQRGIPSGLDSFCGKAEVQKEMRKKQKISTEVLRALNYSSPEEAALDMIFLSARSRYSEFSQEVRQFEEKYHMDIETFQRTADVRVREENFGQEEDLMAWKFAKEAAEYWRQKIEELERAA
ncbi:MAG TPA: hypothetical protein VN444_05705 [Verrucomicrobiae bacterium]|nr:hypothetical protein [Verrucomicrobiae bacterium]